MTLARISLIVLVATFAAYAQTSATVKLGGNRHPLARPEFDRGPVSPEQPVDRIILVLARSAQQQAELDAFVAAQHDPGSPQYQRWLTPEEFGRRFGASDADIRRITDWLSAQGFQIDEVTPGRGSIVFSGTAGQVVSAFRTGIHRFSVNGEMHMANTDDPEIPEALAGVVAGIASLNDFHSQPALASFAAAASPDFTSGSSHYLAPADFATIYDAAPLYLGGIDGAGTSIAVVGRSNFRLTDAQAFRAQMGLTANSPTVILNGPNPGILSSGEQAEATLDVEWAGAIARRAAVKFVLSASTVSSDGVMLSAVYAVNHKVAPVITTSFSMCEALSGAAYATFWNNLWQQAAAQGITSLVASGDSGAAGCDPPSASNATNGPGVNVICSTPYSVCVGGTQFNDSATPALYWSASNGAGLASALSYIPEAVWNTSGTVTGGSALWASGGGVSSVFAKPSWQFGNGVPADSRRHVPDVAASSSPHDGYLIYMNGSFYSVAGTSTATPAWAGIMALVNQHNGGGQGNANPALYGLARLQASGGAAVFHDVVAGNNSVPGVGGFQAGPGYDQATGLGSPDAFQLVQHWKDANIPSTPSR
ncbi:MAG: S8/S53 family peptidase [Bryobacterales bacterium]|nr:S8/S53 family peptidase [Bryobacterales bacterium]